MFIESDMGTISTYPLFRERGEVDFVPVSLYQSGKCLKLKKTDTSLIIRMMIILFE